MRYTEKEVHQKIPQNNRRTTSNASIFLVIYFFNFFLATLGKTCSVSQDEICCVCITTMHFNAAHCISSNLPKKKNSPSEIPRTMASWWFPKIVPLFVLFSFWTLTKKNPSRKRSKLKENSLQLQLFEVTLLWTSSMIYELGRPGERDQIVDAERFDCRPNDFVFCISYCILYFSQTSPLVTRPPKNTTWIKNNATFSCNMSREAFVICKQW